MPASSRAAATGSARRSSCRSARNPSSSVPRTGLRRTGRSPSTAQVEQVAYLGGTVQYHVRTRGGLSITALVSKTGQRLPVGSAVDVAWPPAEALVLAGRTDDAEEETRA